MKTERFTYNPSRKTLRKKTFSLPQKFTLSSLWIIVSAAMIGGIILQQKGHLPQNTFILLLIIFIPLILASFTAFYFAMNPKGPEADFELPSIEMDEADSST